MTGEKAGEDQRGCASWEHCRRLGNRTNRNVVASNRDAGTKAGRGGRSDEAPHQLTKMLDLPVSIQETR